MTHVDASKGMVAWAKENAKSSGLEDAPIRWIVDDCVKFVEREIRRGNHYDAIIMDPPSYGRGPKGEIWKIEDAIYPLVKLCAKLLSDKPLFYLINSYTTGLAPGGADLYARNSRCSAVRRNCKLRGDRTSGYKFQTCTPVRRFRTLGSVIN